MATDHPEVFERGSDGVPWDPDEPLLLRWADVLAVANAALTLKVLLKDHRIDFEAGDHSLGEYVRDWLATGLTDEEGQRLRLETTAETIVWLDALIRRVRNCLP